LSANTLVEPDLVIYPRGIKLEGVKGSNPVGDRSGSDGLVPRPRPQGEPLWRNGVNELWVIDAGRRWTFVHSGPGSTGWRTIPERGRDEALTFAVLPGYSVQLGPI
jgi:hypothetical protein